MKTSRLAFLCLLLIACGRSEEPGPAENLAPASPNPSQHSAETSSPSAPDTVSAVNPARSADPAVGKMLYQANCASCHGPRGAGDGPVAEALNPKPAKHNDGVYMNGLENEYLTRVIRDGGAAVGKSVLMAPWGMTLSDQEIRDLVTFTRSLAEPAYTGPIP